VEASRRHCSLCAIDPTGDIGRKHPLNNVDTSDPVSVWNNAKTVNAVHSVALHG
jgi:hypothetical protein